MDQRLTNICLTIEFKCFFFFKNLQMIKFVAYVGEQFQNKICCEICKEYEIEKTTYIFVSVWRMIP